MGKHGNIIRHTAHPMVKLYYRRYASLEVEETPITLEVSKPEKKTRIKKKVVLLYPPYCRLCGTCVDLCHKKALRINNERLVIYEELCKGCGLCVKNCPAEVLGLEVKQ
ncbi:MAG: 4Fe-4S binding protein [Candidatus Thorarchaeota archaeon]